MLDRTVTKFSHVKPDDTQFRMDGLREFFIYRDLGVAEEVERRAVLWGGKRAAGVGLGDGERRAHRDARERRADGEEAGGEEHARLGREGRAFHPGQRRRRRRLRGRAAARRRDARAACVAQAPSRPKHPARIDGNWIHVRRRRAEN